jgi:hypothetical protein
VRGPARTPGRAWLGRLRGDSPERDRARSELRELLLRAARFEVSRRSKVLSHLRGDDGEDLAQQSADDVLLAIRSKLDDFSGREPLHDVGLQVRPARGRLWTTTPRLLPRAEDDESPDQLQHLAVVPIVRLDLSSLRALAYAASLGQPVVAVHISPGEHASRATGPRGATTCHSRSSTPPTARSSRRWRATPTCCAPSDPN